MLGSHVCKNVMIRALPIARDSPLESTLCSSNVNESTLDVHLRQILPQLMIMIVNHVHKTQDSE